jgi:adenylate kinase
MVERIPHQEGMSISLNRTNPHNMIIVGAQGSGKGTQAEHLTQLFGLFHLSSGDLFRVIIRETTELGAKVRSYLDRGELLPDNLTDTLIFQRLAEQDCIVNGIILDGFPRTVTQAIALDHELSRTNRAITCTIYLQVPHDVLLRRLSARYICRAAQHVYNSVTNPSKVLGICDIDGSELYQRSDDMPAAVQTRLDIFFQETIRLLDYYRAQDKLIEVDGNQSIDQVTEEMSTKLHAFLDRKKAAE